MKSCLIILFCLLSISSMAIPKLNTALPTTTGKASWYGRREQGRHTANGERFDRNQYTCASRTYPFGTLLNVRYPRTGLEVVVRVNDHGPWVGGRMLDLSERAAKSLGLAPYGVDQVIITPVHFKLKEKRSD
jgi:rare lipoprotein A